MIKLIHRQERKVDKAGFSPDGRFYWTSKPWTSLLVRDTLTGRAVVTSDISGHRALFLPSAKRVITCAGATRKLYDDCSGKEIGSTIFGNIKEGPFGTYLVDPSGNPKPGLRLCDAVDGSLLWESVAFSRYLLQDAVFSPNGERIFAISCGPGSLSVLDAETGKVLHHRELVVPYCLDLSADGQYLAVSGGKDKTDRYTHIYRTSDCELVKKIEEPHSARVWFSPDSQFLALTFRGDGLGVQFYTVSSWEKRGPALVHRQPENFRFSQDSELFYTVEREEFLGPLTGLVRKTSTGEILSRTVADNLSSLDLSLDGRLLVGTEHASGGRDGTPVHYKKNDSWQTTTIPGILRTAYIHPSEPKVLVVSGKETSLWDLAPLLEWTS